MPMTWLDTVIVLTICVMAAIGFWKGIVRTIVGIAALFAGVLLAGQFYQTVDQALWPEGSAWSAAAAYALVFFGVLMLGLLAATLLSRLIQMTVFGMVDRAVGLVAGATVAILLWGATIALLAQAITGMDAVLADSPVAALVAQWFVQLTGLWSQPGQPA